MSRLRTAFNAIGLSAPGEGLAEIVVPVRVAVVSDEDGGRRARVSPEQVPAWVEFAAAAFRRAGIRFSFDPRTGFEELRNRSLNDTEGASDRDWPAVKELGNEIADQHPGHLLVLVRHGPGPRATGAAFAGIDHDFVVMGGFDDMWHCGRPQVDALAHEIGHYLGLPHTFVGDPFPDEAAAEAHLAARGGDPGAFDGDGFSDTLPDPAIRSFECERTESVELLGTRFRLPRRNLMSYYDERDSLSPQQLARARWVSERRRLHGMRLPVNRPGPLAFEAETLVVLRRTQCSTAVQAMDGFGAGMWSGDAQLFCGAELGSVLTLGLSVVESASYRIVVHATLAPDFGVLRCFVDGRPQGEPADCYAPLVLPTGDTRLGSVFLEAGDHEITFEVVGRNAASSGHHFGIDAIELRR